MGAKSQHPRDQITDLPNSSFSSPTKQPHFGIPELDSLIPNPPPTILELISPPPTHHPSGAGKTSLLYLIIAHAILPASFSSIRDLGGQNSAVILFDPLHHFSVPRLASTILNLLVEKLQLQTPLSTLDPDLKAEILSLTTRCLDHVHIFRPSSWDSLLSTLSDLPTYLFTPTNHKSTHRRIHSLTLEDIDTFLWSLRHSHTTTTTNPNPLTPASHTLTTHLTHLTTLLSCTAILTSLSTTPTSFRPALPTSWPAGITVARLAVRRVDVLKFAPEMGVEQAEGERGQRWDVVRRGRFECWRIGRQGEEEGGFVFRVGEGGVVLERDGV